MYHLATLFACDSLDIKCSCKHPKLETPKWKEGHTVSLRFRIRAMKIRGGVMPSEVCPASLQIEKGGGHEEIVGTLRKLGEFLLIIQESLPLCSLCSSGRTDV